MSGLKSIIEFEKESPTGKNQFLEAMTVGSKEVCSNKPRGVLVDKSDSVYKEGRGHGRGKMLKSLHPYLFMRELKEKC